MDYPTEHEEAVLKKVARMIGYLPVGTMDLLRVLAHPDVLPLTKAYLDAVAELDNRPEEATREFFFTLAGGEHRRTIAVLRARGEQGRVHAHLADQPCNDRCADVTREDQR